jgi:hypothetical protein
MNRLQVLSQALSGTVPDQKISEVLFYLQQLKNNSSNPIGAMLVLSQFAVIHETVTQETSDLLINDISKDITLDNKSGIEASMLGIKAICGTLNYNYALENSPRLLKHILGKILSSSGLKEGEILTLILMEKSIRMQCRDKINEIIQKVCPMITSDRLSQQKRIYAIYLLGSDFTLIFSGTD